ncbi:hypothetical protein FIBSPDRAFT_979463 [Athelia psychrophila]|uniref:Uncharacterized protein n=1 Tax=Athelia psychrophila TaxID=1759441 RepID=A0A166DNQ0_9AGAM|nr:hypothetical protein FIBSPDRAFT_979463 [Fibularhizoctonia sp. CBS 109695]
MPNGTPISVQTQMKRMQPPVVVPQQQARISSGGGMRPPSTPVVASMSPNHTRHSQGQFGRNRHRISAPVSRSYAAVATTRQLDNSVETDIAFLSGLLDLHGTRNDSSVEGHIAFLPRFLAPTRRSQRHDNWTTPSKARSHSVRASRPTRHTQRQLRRRSHHISAPLSRSYTALATTQQLNNSVESEIAFLSGLLDLHGVRNDSSVERNIAFPPRFSLLHGARNDTTTIHPSSNAHTSYNGDCGEVHNVNGSHVTIYTGPVYNYTICECNHVCRNHHAVDTADAWRTEPLSATEYYVAFLKFLLINLIWYINEVDTTAFEAEMEAYSNTLTRTDISKRAHAFKPIVKDRTAPCSQDDCDDPTDPRPKAICDGPMCEQPTQQRETVPTTSLELLTKHGGRFDSGLSSSGKDNEVTAGADINGLVHDPSSFAKLTGKASYRYNTNPNMLTPQKDVDSRKNADPEPVSGWDIRDAESLGMPADIVDLVDAFPMGLTDCRLNKSHFTDRNFLPTRSRGYELVELYYRNVSWMYDPIIRSDFMATVFDPIYGSNELPSVTHVHAHRMSILLIVVATGALYDKDPYATRLAHQYNVLVILQRDGEIQESIRTTSTPEEVPSEEEKVPKGQGMTAPAKARMDGMDMGARQRSRKEEWRKRSKGPKQRRLIGLSGNDTYRPREIIGIDDAEMGEYAYDYVGLRDGARAAEARLGEGAEPVQAMCTPDRNRCNIVQQGEEAGQRRLSAERVNRQSVSESAR